MFRNKKVMKVSAAQIAELIDGKIEGEPSVLVTGPAKIEEGMPGAISFLGNNKYESHIYTCKSSVIIVQKDFIPKQSISATLIRVKDVYSSVSALMQYFSNTIIDYGQKEISDQAFIHPSATIGKNVRIEAFAYVAENVKIGDNCIVQAHCYLGRSVSVGNNCILHSGVKVHWGCILEQDVVIHSNAVIGSDGFGFSIQKDGSYHKIPQLGIVHVAENVEIGANTVIDRATMDVTLIHKGVKLDNLIQIAHNVEIGENSVMAAQVGVAGSTKIGKNCTVGGQAGFAGHLKIANGTRIQAQSGIGQDVKQEYTALWGSPAIDYKKYFRCAYVFKNLPELQKQVYDLGKIIALIRAEK